jgi:lysophospholipase L1-like esterase
MRRLFILAVWALTHVMYAQELAPLPQEIPPTDKRLHYIARLDPRDPAGPRFDWSGSSVFARFEGTAISAKLASSGRDRLQVVVDGVPTEVIPLTIEPRRYALAKDLALGSHTVALYKRTEPIVGTVQFFGFQLEAGAKLLAAPRLARRLEFIGDSITAGYGNEAANPHEPFTPGTENHYLTWNAIAARALEAESLAIAISGSRLTETPKLEAMPAFYRRTLFADKTHAWNFRLTPPPDAVVINLGTNDYFQGALDEKAWTAAYDALLDFVRGNYPQAHVWLTIGPMIEPGPKLDAMRLWNAAIVTRRTAAGDVRIHALEFPPQKLEDGLGADAHPSVKTHAKMAEQLIAELKRVLGW